MVYFGLPNVFPRRRKTFYFIVSMYLGKIDFFLPRPPPEMAKSLGAISLRNAKMVRPLWPSGRDVADPPSSCGPTE